MRRLGRNFCIGRGSIFSIHVFLLHKSTPPRCNVRRLHRSRCNESYSKNPTGACKHPAMSWGPTFGGFTLPLRKFFQRPNKRLQASGHVMCLHVLGTSELINSSVVDALCFSMLFLAWCALVVPSEMSVRVCLRVRSHMAVSRLN